MKISRLGEGGKMKTVVKLTYRHMCQSFAFVADKMSDDEFRQLIRLEFQIPADLPFSLEYADLVLPAKVSSVESNRHYRLRTYASDCAPAATLHHWSEHRNSDGKPYYYNSMTRRAQWNKPEIMGTRPPRPLWSPTSEALRDWSEHVASNGDVYYVNSATGESQWERPESEAYSGDAPRQPPAYPPPAPVRSMPIEEDHNDDGTHDGAEFVEDPWEDERYFDSYDNLEMQRSMVQDAPRSLAYQRALEGPDAAADLRGKVVLDVGCGTGLLSFFAARAGARKVYAVEASALAGLTREIVQSSPFRDVISVHECRVEELELPEKVDVIVSEWMGSMLLFESMLESVIIARDAWLSPGGVMLPSCARLYFAPVEDAEYWHKHISSWSDVYGVDMSAVLPRAHQQWTRAPVWDRTLPPTAPLAPAILFATFDMHSMTAADMECVQSEFVFEAERDGELHAFAAWFDVRFGGEKGILLNTAPSAEPTHWRQEMFFLDTSRAVKKGDVLRGRARFLRHPRFRRHYVIDISFFDGQDVAVQKRWPRWRVLESEDDAASDSASEQPEDDVDVENLQNTGEIASF